jgi:predicted esterase
VVAVALGVPQLGRTALASQPEHRAAGAGSTAAPMHHEHHLTVERTARYFTIEPAEGAAREVWFGLHGYGQLAGKFLRVFEGLADGTRLIVAPEALARFYLHPDPPPTGMGHVGASWMTREDRLSEIADNVAYLDALARHVFRRVARETATLRVLGFSQGAFAAARWAAQGTTRVDQLILWGGSLPPELDLGAAPPLGRLPVLIVWGEQDQYYDATKVAHDEQRLAVAGIPCRVVTYPGGHQVSRELLLSIAAE